MSFTVNTPNIPSTYAARPGYQPVATQEFHQPPPPPAYTTGPSGYAPAGSQPQYYQPQPHPGYAQQQSSTNVVVVQQSAAAVFPVVVRPDGYRPDAGQPALLFSMIITIFALVCGCWWSIVCSIPGMVFATSATSAGIRGDQEGVRSNNNLAYGCTIGALVAGVIGVGAIFGLVFGLRNCSYSSYGYRYCSYY